MSSMLVERIVWHVADHSKDCQLPHIQQGFSWQATRQEVHDTPGGLGVKTLEVLESNLVVPVYSLDFLQTEIKGCHS